MREWLTRLWARLRKRPDGQREAETESREWAGLTERARGDMEARITALAPMRHVVVAMSTTLLAHDPVGLGRDGEPDEYDSEAETIVLRFADGGEITGDEALRIVHEEFVKWFGPDLAGPRSRYVDAAEDVAAIWAAYVADPDA